MNRLIQQILGVFLALFFALQTAPSVAQSASPYMSDIDIYSTGDGSVSPPNILFIFDNTANWGANDGGEAIFEYERRAMVNTLTNIPDNMVRVGLMMYNETGGDNRGDSGGYVRAAVRTLDAGYRPVFTNLIRYLNVGDDKGSKGLASLAMSEAYYYFAGLAPYSGNQKIKTDYTGNINGGTTYSNQVYLQPNNALGGYSASPYNKPQQDGCSRNYIVFVSNGAAQDDNNSKPESKRQLEAQYARLNMTYPGDLTLNPSGSQDNPVDEWARFMKASPEAITTFTLDVNPVTNGQGPGWSALLKSMAVRSGGEYFAVTASANNGADIANALQNIVNQILSVNSVFASASLPVSVNTRGSYLNQVFMGMFRPDAAGKPRWRGNLKQYKFGYDPVTDTLNLQDSANQQAVTSGTTGFIKPEAISFWTESSTFFTNDPMGTPRSGSDSPDGEIVEKGGAAQRLRTTYATDQSTRKVYTCLSGTCNDLTASTNAFTSTNTSLTGSTLFGTLDTTSKQNLINWVRGNNNVASDPLDLGPGGTTTVRPSIHGDVLHSRPAVVNYGGSSGTNNIVVFYGSNDGTIRAINGNQTATYGGVAAGGEFWSFVPKETIGKLNRLRTNSPEVRLATTVVASNATTPPTARDYFADGPVSYYQKVSSAGTPTAVYLFVGLRRGGNALYAFDVTNVNAPKLMWTKTQTDLSTLGQTWSEAKVTRLKGYVDTSTGKAKPVVVMGGGYDAAAEDTITPATNTTVGNRVYVFDAVDGTKLAELSFSGMRSVPADISLMDTDYDGYVDRGYGSDVHGNVFRIDFEVTKTCSPSTATCGMTKDDWQIRQIASLSDGTTKRKVFFPPDVVRSKDTLRGDFMALMIGTGDREKPLCGKPTTTSTVSYYDCRTTGDGFYTVFDTVPKKPNHDYTRTVITAANIGQVGTDQNQVQGCVIPMNTGGEKVINAPLTVGGYTYFSTNQPPSSTGSTCTGNLGQAKVYGAKAFCQGAISEIRNGGGMPPSPVSGVVAVSYVDPTTNATVNKQVPFVIGGIADPGAADPNLPGNDTGCGLAGCKPVINVAPNRARKYWFVENPR